MASGQPSNMLEKSQMAGGAAVALLVTLVLPWADVGFGSMSMLDAMYEMFRSGGLDGAPPEVLLFVVGFFITLILAAIIAFNGLVHKSVGKMIARVTGGLGLILMVVVLIALGDAAGGLDQVMQFVGIGYYLFAACAAWLAWLGFQSPTRAA